ncbi:MAG: GtrA family protein [Oscillospiraceae bacterium]|nr:GtrA family protein [Oscillospiraceae bacterium]
MDNKNKNKSKVSVFLRACFKIVKLEKLYDKHEEVMLYLFFGALTTLISIVTKLAIFFAVPGEPLWENTTGVVISWIFAVTFAFFTNKEYVFENKTETPAEFRKVFLSFYGARVATLIMEELIFIICCDLLGISNKIITFASQIIILVANYVLSKLFVFKKKDESNE